MTKENLAPLVRVLVKATGLTKHGVYKCLREKRAPNNPLVRSAWEKALAAAKAKPRPAHSAKAVRS